MTTEQQILEIIGWYRELPADFLGISEIMYERKQLSTLGATLSVEMGEARRKWKMSEYKLKSLSNQKKISLLKTMSLTKAEIFIKANPTIEEESAVKWEIAFNQKYYLFKALTEVLSEMNQRVSYLKEEQKQDRFFGNDD